MLVNEHVAGAGDRDVPAEACAGACANLPIDAALAQLAEQLFCKQVVNSAH